MSICVITFYYRKDMGCVHNSEIFIFRSDLKIKRLFTLHYYAYIMTKVAIIVSDICWTSSIKANWVTV